MLDHLIDLVDRVELVKKMIFNKVKVVIIIKNKKKILEEVKKL